MFVNFLHNITFLLFLFLGIAILIRNRKSAINLSVFLLMLMFAIWSLSISFLENIYVDKNTANIFLNLSNFAAIGYGIFTFVSVGLFTKKIKMSIYLYILIACYLITYIIIVLNTDIFNLGEKNEFGFWEVLYGNKLIISILNIIHNTLIISSFIMLFVFIRKTKDVFKYNQAKTILIAGLIAFLLASINVFAPLIIDSLTMPNLVDVCMLIFAFGLVYSIVKYDLFKIAPTLLLEQIIETMPIGFILADEQKSIFSVNSKVKEITEKRNSFFINKNIKDLISEITSSRIIIEDDIFFTEKTELNFWDNNKSIVIYFKPIVDKHNRILAFALMIDDIDRLVSAEKKLSKYNLLLEKRVKKRTEELLQAKEKAEESSKLKTAFLQNISHEIRTPLNAICGFSGMLNNSALSEEKRNNFVSIIQNSSNQLLSIVTDILTISSIETKQEEVSIAETNINILINELLVIFNQQAINRNISIYSKQGLPDKDSVVYTDKTKLTQILTNLLLNALKFTRKGIIEFGYNLKNNELEFYVKDSGIGIPKEQHEKIFDRFNQANTHIQQTYGGTGLGLSISKGFVEVLGGNIWVNSEPDKGSTFYFTIPYKAANIVNLKVETKNKPFRKPKQKSLLIAEDEEFNFMLIAELLVDMDLKIFRAKNGQEAVTKCDETPEIDLILMDIKMPIMDGHTAANIIKQKYPDLTIIAQTAYALDHEIKQYGDVFDDYLIKPIKKEILINTIIKYFN